jgi:beta-lactamase class A
LNRKGGFSIFRWISLVFIFIAVLLTVFQLVAFSRVRSIFPAGMRVAGVPVGGLDQKQAADRLIQAYGVPIELRYGDAIIQVKPALVGFDLDLEGMLATADLQRLNRAFWPAFWDYLWNRQSAANEIPLSATISESRLRAYLKDEIAARYDQLPLAAMPVPGTTTFQAGQPGTILDAERAVILIEDALRSPAARVVNLSFNQVSPPRPAYQNLQILLKQIIDLSRFDGLIEMYVEDLQTHQELHFALKGGADIQPDIAFTAASTMKIPIMISTFRRVGEPAPKEVTDLVELMIERSENDPADSLMKTVLDPDTGPLRVTEDMEALGLNSTFLAGYFYPGAPLLKKITTPANQRTDISTDPDLYNQTTPLELGMLLDDLYQCAQTGGGTLAAAFPTEVTQNECRQMITYLTRNKIAVLLEAGLPEGAQIAHKHGWITSNDGLIHTIGDAGIVYTPGGNYVITIYMYHPVQLLFDPANQLVAQLSAAVYNYFNLVNK